MHKYDCPICHGEVDFEFEPVVDQRALCSECQNPIKVVGISPVELVWAFEDLLESPEYSIRSFPHRWRKFPG